MSVVGGKKRMGMYIAAADSSPPGLNEDVVWRFKLWDGAVFIGDLEGRMEDEGWVLCDDIVTIGGANGAAGSSPRSNAIIAGHGGVDGIPFEPCSIL